jgi:hypothetical protein
MKKRNLLIILSLFTSLCSAQITIDSVKVYGDSTGFDSVYIKYSSYIPQINSFTYRSFNDACGTTNSNIAFKGCSTLTSVQKDTVLKFGFWGVASNFLRLYTVWDTSTTCNSPTNPINTDSYFYNICNLTSVDELENLASKVVIYPNPAQAFFNLEMSDGITLSRVELIDLQGSLIKTFETQYARFDLNSVANGVYYLKLTASEGIAVKKIVVTH